MSTDKDLDATIAALEKSITKPVYSSDISHTVKTKSADKKVLNELAKSIRSIINSSQEDAKPQHST